MAQCAGKCNELNAVQSVFIRVFLLSKRIMMRDFSASLPISQTKGSSIGPSEHGNEPYRERWEMTMRSHNNISELMLSCQYGFGNKPMYPVCVSLCYDRQGSVKKAGQVTFQTQEIS